MKRIAYKNLNYTELKSREAAWYALSDLWLDNELSEFEIIQIAQTLQKTKLSKADLEDLYLYEVAPIVYFNLLSITGEWAGFEKRWLCNNIVTNLENWSKWKQRKYNFLKPFMTYATRDYWKKILKYIFK